MKHFLHNYSGNATWAYCNFTGKGHINLTSSRGPCNWHVRLFHDLEQYWNYLSFDLEYIGLNMKMLSVLSSWVSLSVIVGQFIGKIKGFSTVPTHYYQAENMQIISGVICGWNILGDGAFAVLFGRPRSIHWVSLCIKNKKNPLIIFWSQGLLRFRCTVCVSHF